MWSPVLMMQNYGFLSVEEYDGVEQIEPEHMMMAIEMMVEVVVVLME
jgi:GTPase